MLDFGKHAVFIWGSYGVVAVVLGLLITWLALTGRAHARALAELEAQGVRRRSASSTSADPGPLATTDTPQRDGAQP
ncbi:MAG: heme exporter protein CcmD [Pseudomonadota bacterium]